MKLKKINETKTFVVYQKATDQEADDIIYNESNNNSDSHNEHSEEEYSYSDFLKDCKDAGWD